MSWPGAGPGPGSLPLTVTTPGEPPEGWTGKLWALRHGVELAGDAEYLLLTDADIAHGPHSLDSLVAAAVSSPTESYDLVSQMARLRTETRWERLIVPAFVSFFAELYPFRRSNDPRSRTAAAAGGCTLVRREALERGRGSGDQGRGDRRREPGEGGEARRRPDLAGPGRPVDSVRPDPGSGSCGGWCRAAPTPSCGTRCPAGRDGAGATLAPGAAGPSARGAVAGDPAVYRAAGAAWALMALTYLPMLRYYRQPAAAALLLPFTAALYLLMTVDSAVQHWRGRGAAWKGRTYPAPSKAADVGSPTG